MEWAFFVLIVMVLVVAIFCIGKYIGNSENDNSDTEDDDLSIISDPRIREIVKELKEEVKEYSKKLDQKILELFDELEIQFDGSKRHYAFSGSHEKPPIREIRTAARAFQFKYGANVDGKDTFDQRDESKIARGETWRSVWNITKEEKKAFALTWDSKEKKARLTIVDYSDRF